MPTLAFDTIASLVLALLLIVSSSACFSSCARVEKASSHDCCPDSNAGSHKQNQAKPCGPGDVALEPAALLKSFDATGFHHATDSAAIETLFRLDARAPLSFQIALSPPLLDRSLPRLLTSVLRV